MQQPKTRSFYRVNQRIQASQIRLIDSNGINLGIKPLSEGIQLARTRELDLVEIAPQGTPPVCKVIDYSKFRYEQDKKYRESRKKQKSGIMKEVRMRPNIGRHDLGVKLRHVEEFLGEHEKVRITIVFRGRENAHKEVGFSLMQSVQETLSGVAVPEGTVSREGNRIMLIFIPKH